MINLFCVAVKKITVFQLNAFCRIYNVGNLIAILGSIDFVLGSIDCFYIL
jgi:NADH:ubiquinone oxidoreductase subunit D